MFFSSTLLEVTRPSCLAIHFTVISLHLLHHLQMLHLICYLLLVVYGLGSFLCICLFGGWRTYCPCCISGLRRNTTWTFGCFCGFFHSFSSFKDFTLCCLHKGNSWNRNQHNLQRYFKRILQFSAQLKLLFPPEAPSYNPLSFVAVSWPTSQEFPYSSYFPLVPSPE